MEKGKGYLWPPKTRFQVSGPSGTAAKTREWCGVELQCYLDFDKEAAKRALSFITRNAQQKKPFFVEWWPLFTPFVPAPQKTSLQRGLVGDAYEVNLDPTAGLLLKTLRDLGIAENTLVIAMSDNGPMTNFHLSRVGNRILVIDTPTGIAGLQGAYRLEVRVQPVRA